MEIHFAEEYSAGMKVDLTRTQCEELLARNHYAHLGCIIDDEPYVVPITYVFREGILYGATHEGRKIDAMRARPKVCVQTETVASPHEWESVVCMGRFEEVKDHTAAQQIKLMLAEEFGKHVLKKEEPPVSTAVEDIQERKNHPHADAVAYRIIPERMTGRAEKI